MTDLIKDAIAACEWNTVQFLFISDNVFAPLVYYSHLTPAIVAAIFGAGFYFLNRRDPLNKTFFFVGLAMSLWLILDLIVWATDQPSISIFSWSIVNLIEPFIYLAMIHLIILFAFRKPAPLWINSILALPLIPVLFLAPTEWNILGFNLTDCDRDLVEGPLVSYNYIVEVVYTAFTICLIAYALTSKKVQESKIGILLVGVTAILTLLSLVFGNIVGTFTEDWTLGQYGLFGIPIFFGALVYILVQYKYAQKNQILLSQILIAFVWIAVASILFIRFIENVRVVVIGTLILLTAVGYLLIRSSQREIEQRKLIEEQKAALEKSNMRLKELDRAKSEFLSIASHQLRTPLAAIRGYLSLITEGEYGAISEKIKEPMAHIQESARLMNTSIEDYLNVSRIEQGRMKYEMQDLDLAELTKTTAEELANDVKRKGLALSLDIALPTAPVYGDLGKLKQLISNLIDNSIKYTQKGSITVSLTEGTGSTVRVVVSDTGVGVPKEEIGGLFEKFKRAAGAGKVNTTGTGLGLYVAKNIVEAHKGKIWVESDGPGKGSRFIFEVPRK